MPTKLPNLQELQAFLQKREEISKKRAREFWSTSGRSDEDFEIIWLAVWDLLGKTLEDFWKSVGLIFGNVRF
jgi:hypothetical protein